MEFPVTITRRNLWVGAAAFAVVSLAAISVVVRHGPWTKNVPEIQPNLVEASTLEEMVLGDPNAPVTIIEYASMTCPHCAHFEETTYPELKKRYIDTGKVRLIFREFPLDPLAAAGAMLARCAGKDKYFPLIETLFRTQKDWVVAKDPITPLLNIAKQVGFTKQSFDQCLSDEKLLAGIEAARQSAADKLGVNSTPTFFINGQVHRGDLSIDEVDKVVQPYFKS
jgi:protein-disulfide isomerase